MRCDSHHLCAQYMLELPLTSAAPQDPMSFGFGYSKFALETLSQAFAHEYEDQRIRFNILVPGRVYSDGFPHRMGDLGHEYDTDHIRKGLLCMLDTDMNAEVVDAVSEMQRGGDGGDDD